MTSQSNPTDMKWPKVFIYTWRREYAGKDSCTRVLYFVCAHWSNAVTLICIAIQKCLIHISFEKCYCLI